MQTPGDDSTDLGEPTPRGEPKPQFAIITANGTEQNVVKHYLKLERLCGKVHAELMGYDWKHDPFLKEMKVEITVNDPEEVYDVFTIGEVMGVHVNCTRSGSGGARDTTSDLLKKASKEEWPLKVIFVVGCCGVSMSDAKKTQKNWRGTVLLSEQMEDYLDYGKAVEGGLLSEPRTYTLCGTWVNRLSEESICQPAVEEERQRNIIPVERVGKYLSGPLVIKSEEEGNKYRGNNCQIAGIEMEGAMVYTTVDRSAMKDTKVAVVKGISDYADTDKNKLAKSMVFGKETGGEIDEKTRQEIATFNAITLVTRCVARNAKRL